MSASRRSPWYYPWAPLGIGALTVAAVVALLLAGPPGPAGPGRRRRSRPQAAAGFQTTDKLILTVNLPARREAQPADTLRVELIDPDGKVLDSATSAGPARRRPHRPPLRAGLAEAAGRQGDAALHASASEKIETPLDKVLLVKAHETALSAAARSSSPAPPPPSAARSTASSPSPRPCRWPAPP